MPIYEYRCAKCGNTFEKLEKFSDPPLKKHEKCGGKVERLISASGFHLKGGGWYVTDYGKGGTKPEKPASTESKSETKSETTTTSTATETKTESKPKAEKPAAKT